MMNIRAFEHYMSIDSERYSEPSLEALNDYATCFMYTVPFRKYQRSKWHTYLCRHQ